MLTFKASHKVVIIIFPKAAGDEMTFKLWTEAAAAAAANPP